jgi:hypothetical protein
MLFLLSIIKIVGIILAGAFSALGLFTDFKDKKTQAITRWGRIALYGIITSTFVSLPTTEERASGSETNEEDSEPSSQMSLGETE